MAFLVAAALSVKFGASPLVDMPSSHDAGCHHKMALAASAETEPPAGMLTVYLISNISVKNLRTTRRCSGDFFKGIHFYWKLQQIHFGKGKS